MNIKSEPPEELPDGYALSETLRLLVAELHGCAATLRETHNLIAPQLDELERRYPNALALRTPDDGQGSLGGAQGRDPA